MNLRLNVPEPDYDGFESYIRQKYTNNRWSHVEVREDNKSGGYVKVKSGEHPAYSRFIKDLKPVLHEYGFVISSTHEDAFNGVEEEMVDGEEEKVVQRCHEITGIPILWVVAYANGYICKRGACRNIIDVEDSAYCSSCDGMNEYTGDLENNALRMINP